MARRHEITGQVFTHQYLWNCATTLLTRPETKSPEDKYYAMAGMVMAYFTFEAYLNFVGSSVEQTAWKDERKFFSKKPYRGTQGKLKLLCEKYEIKLNPDERPYLTVRQAGWLRDYLAHGKPDYYVSEVHVEEGKAPDMFGGLKIDDLVTREKADRTLQDTEEFIEYLHRELAAKRKRPNPYDVTFVGRALNFPLASASSSTRHPR
jgi:hypothetical protein